MSARTFGMYHRTVVPENFEAAEAESDDSAGESTDRASGADAARHPLSVSQSRPDGS